MGSIGALESAFLTYQKLNPAGLDLLCGASGGCLDVLNGPYSNVLVSFFLGKSAYMYITRSAVVHRAALSRGAVGRQAPVVILLVNQPHGVWCFCSVCNHWPLSWRLSLLETRVSIHADVYMYGYVHGARRERRRSILKATADSWCILAVLRW